jgi:hypothetical protein
MNDFHLQSTSPCINSGTDVGLLEDKDGTILPQGSGFDIGVYEYITLLLPTVKLNSIQDITETSVMIEGEVIDAGSEPVIERGIGIRDNFGNMKIYKLGNGVGVFNSVFNNLIPNTNYEAVSYAISYDTVYSKVSTFETLPLFKLPICETLPIKDLSSNIFQTGIKYIDDGGSRIIEGGICYVYCPIKKRDKKTYLTISDVFISEVVPYKIPTIKDNKIKTDIPVVFPSSYLIKFDNNSHNNEMICIRSYSINSKGVGYGKTFFKKLSSDIPIIDSDEIIIQDTVLIYLDNNGFIKIK